MTKKLSHTDVPTSSGTAFIRAGLKANETPVGESVSCHSRSSGGTAFATTVTS